MITVKGCDQLPGVAFYLCAFAVTVGGTICAIAMSIVVNRAACGSPFISRFGSFRHLKLHLRTFTWLQCDSHLICPWSGIDSFSLSPGSKRRFNNTHSC